MTGSRWCSIGILLRLESLRSKQQALFQFPEQVSTSFLAFALSVSNISIAYCWSLLVPMPYLGLQA